ncbi:allergin-1-like [Hypanus sabinus]|uniref:allergin-1-like n=1 Tax=Hypanus sabinus TaxID=79690 RepID=UPI0028C4DDD9|nr:allergin-1-like [Hypanus sabinus]
MLKPVNLVLVQLLFCCSSAPGVKSSPVTESVVPRIWNESVPATTVTEGVCCPTAPGSSPASTHHGIYGISAMDLQQVPNPEIKSVTSKTTLEIGNSISLQCHSINGSFPVTYSLFLHTKHISTIKKPNNEPAIFNVRINNTEDGGVYKCKATNEISGVHKYSKGISFTIKGTASYKWLYYTIVPLLLLVGILVIICIEVGRNQINKRRPLAHTSQPSDSPQPINLPASRCRREDQSAKGEPYSHKNIQTPTSIVLEYKTHERHNQDTNVDNSCSNEDKVIYTQLNLQSQKNKKAQQQEAIVYATINFNE